MSSVLKCTREWQLAQWRTWPRAEDWPGVLDLFEAAAYRRVHPDTIRRACTPGGDKKAELAHQRIGQAYRIDRSKLERLGAVSARSAA